MGQCNKLIKSISMFIFTMIFVVPAYLINLGAIYLNFKLRVIGFDNNYPGFPNIFLIIFLAFGSLYYGFTNSSPLFKSGSYLEKKLGKI